ncbi:integral membrane protein PTH11 [Fusarium fujikuroi]|nr:integral membrane protein PTH11 [Fusarium fujikuroi]SCO25233.1 related to integral membrane protein PTH11 [Fusarium fujikuroi]
MHLLVLLVTWACLVCQVFCDNVSDFLTKIPDCAGSCLVELVSTSTCGIDVQCLCADPKLKTQVLSCVQKKCLPRDALVACDFPVRDRHAQFDILAITLIAITAIVVGLRLWHKLRYERKFRLDDYIIVAVFVSRIRSTSKECSANSDSYLIWETPLFVFMAYLYIGQTLYASDVFLTKICVALFYLRIFPVVSVQRLIWGTIVFSVLGMILFDILAIAQCQPISFYWTGWDKLHEGHCLGVQPLAWAIAAVGIILDVWMLAIPIWQLVQLQMKWQRKLAVAIMFTVGTFVTIVSILRLRYLVAFGNSQNPTWDSFETCYWSVIEINVGLWCVCLPDLRMLILKAFPRLGSSIESGPRNPHQGSSAPRQQGRTPNSSRHTESTIYKGKPIQAQQEASSSTAELVEMTTFMNDSRSVV